MMSRTSKRVSLRNHLPASVPRTYEQTAADRSQPLKITVVVRSRGSQAEWRKLVARSVQSLPRERRYLTRREFGEAWGATPEDLERVSAYGRRYGLETELSDPWRRCVVLSGTVEQCEAAFGVDLLVAKGPEESFLTHRGVPKVGVAIAPLIEAVLGLYTRRTARPHTALKDPFGGPRKLGVPKLRKVYEFPRNVGEGQCVGIIELDGGWYRSDYEEYCRRIGIAPPAIRVRTVNGAKNKPASKDAIRKMIEMTRRGEPLPNTPEANEVVWTCEAAMDTQIVASLAPKAKQLLVFSTDDAQGEYHAITSVLADRRDAPSVVSCSWGDDEGLLLHVAMLELNWWFEAAAVLGVTFCCSSGDLGDGTLAGGDALVFTAHFPASNPYVLACGGTKLDARSRSETAWQQTISGGTMAGGGGFSTVFGLPPWQVNAGIDAGDWIPAKGQSGNGSAYSDVAAKANFDNAFCYITGGLETPIGGTSASAPLWASLLTVLNERLGTRLGLINPALYGTDLKGAMRDVTYGNIGHLCAMTGWDPATGWGTPDGEAMLDVLAGGG